MVIRVGILGFSPGNGHPFSFSAIINGYDDKKFAHIGWPVIHEYLRRRNVSEFGVDGARVTCVWMPDPHMANLLASACKIDTVVKMPEEMIGCVDAVMILRDDPESHRSLSEPFLKAGLPVFIDKPLTLSRSDLEFFRPFLLKGQLMSCASLRHAIELDAFKSGIKSFGDIRVIRAFVLNDWGRYGIHMLEALQGAIGGTPAFVARTKGTVETYEIQLDNKLSLSIDVLGDVPKIFRVLVCGTKRIEMYDLHDNFSAFKRTIEKFIQQVRTGVPSIEPSDTLSVIDVIIKGYEAARADN